MLMVSTFILLHEKNNLASQFFVIISYYRFTYEIHKRLYVHPRAVHYNLYSITFPNYRFHTIGKYVQNYRYRLSTDMANIGPIPIIGQSLIIRKAHHGLFLFYFIELRHKGRLTKKHEPIHLGRYYTSPPCQLFLLLGTGTALTCSLLHEDWFEKF